MSVDSLMEYQRIWIEGLNCGDVSVGDSAFAPDCVVHITGVAEPIRGVGPWKEFVAGFLQAFPDLHFTMEDQLVQGDLVAFRWRATGTHTGPLGPAPANGQANSDRRADCRPGGSREGAGALGTIRSISDVAAAQVRLSGARIGETRRDW